jgi:hypothetical protein
MLSMASRFESPQGFCDFVDTVIDRLKALGLDAVPLESVRRTAYSSGHEWLGDLGLAVMQVTQQRITDAELRNDLARILDEVERVWPAIRRQRGKVLPELRGRLLNNRFGTVVWAIVAIFIFRSVIAAALRGDEPWPLLLLRSAIALPFVWAAWYMWSSAKWYRRLTYLMRYVDRVPVSVEFGITTESALLATLTPTEPSPWSRVSVICEEPKWDVKRFHGTIVQAHIDPQPKGPVVIVTPQGIIWPHERGRIERQ